VASFREAPAPARDPPPSFDDGAAPGLYVAAPAAGPILFGRSVDPTPPPTAPGAAAAIS
jgi:hypothetical protein